MRKLIPSIICFFVLSFASSLFAWNPMTITTAGLTCQLFYTYDCGGTPGNCTADQNIISDNTLEMKGPFIQVGASAIQICEVDVYIEDVEGTITNFDYYMSIHTVDDYGGADYDLSNTWITNGQSAMISGSDISDSAGWISSKAAGNFTFSTPPTLAANTVYGIVIWYDVDDDTLPDGLGYDGSNYWEWNHGDETSADGTQLGLGEWEINTLGASHALTQQDVEDDVLIRIYTMQ